MSKPQPTKLTQLFQPIICVVGLGYVGLSLAEAFFKSFKVIGFDIDTQKVHQLTSRQSETPTNSTNSISSTDLVFTTNPQDISQADFILICVPTPVTKSKEPDLSYVKSAAETVGQNIKKGSVVILESTVYPGSHRGDSEAHLRARIRA